MKRQAVSKWSEHNYKEKSDSQSEAPVNFRTVAGLVLARFIGAKLSWYSMLDMLENFQWSLFFFSINNAVGQIKNHSRG